MDKKDFEQLVKKAEKMVKYETDKVMTWCSNCGNFGIQNALTRALVLEDMERNDFLLCFDIGCNGNAADKFEAYTIHGLHGRVISLAAGAALANERMKVIAFAGDGATFSEGVNHLVHGIRNNYNMVFIHHNNENYGLTIGQASACTRKGVKMNGTMDGVVVDPINPVEFALNMGPSFVARGYSGNVDQLTDIMRAALNHKGFAFVEVLQACPTYNRSTPDAWYGERMKDISELKGYDRGNLEQARRVAADMDKDIYSGILYVNESKQDLLSLQKSREGAKTQLVDEVKFYDVSELM